MSIFKLVYKDGDEFSQGLQHQKPLKVKIGCKSSKPCITICQLLTKTF